MESANERITSSPSSSPLPSSSDHLQAPPESKGTGNTDPKINQTLTGSSEISSTGKVLNPNTPASTAASLVVDVSNDVISSDNANATINPSPTGSFLSASYTDEDFLGSSTSRTDEALSLGNDPAATQFPLTQVMERPSDTASASGYRIPDYVFARKPSAAPMEWSAASNESLFSIQMGNMSFTREQFSYLGKSGELGMPGELNMSYIDFSSNQPPDKQVEFSQNSRSLVEGPSPRVTEAKAVETMRQVIMESAENDSKASPSSSADNHSKGSPSPRLQNHAVSPSLTDNKFNSPSVTSHASNGSTKSFAFPILAGSEDRSSSLKIDGIGKQKQQYSPRGQPHQKQNSPRIDSRPQTPRESSTPNAASQPSKSVLATVKHKWLSCFSCCSCFN
uniref:cell wall protein RBR3 n=1 Tax=Fragaria vesca subsp. vesca TaxID=101020 RepID=UPI0005CB6181|nr:PREDICTED: cell wall protein RBR3 [Fragaria vesca subsp. vesca]XP_011464309.1 PREDICTED: cell wall protein RBR3 [Fragaria vesca subsp. vesca]